MVKTVSYKSLTSVLIRGRFIILQTHNKRVVNILVSCSPAATVFHKDKSNQIMAPHNTISYEMHTGFKKN